METIKSPRFWVTIAALVATTVLACLKVISGDMATGVILGVTGGWGIAKVNAGDIKTGGSLLLVAGALGGLLALGGCATMPDGGKTLDKCKAMKYAPAAHALASGLSALVCTFLPEKNKAACFKAAAAGKAAGDLVIKSAEPVAESCDL